MHDQRFCFWLWHYRPEWLLPDAIAGLTLAAYAIPVSLAYASLAGVPPESGLYCYMVGGVGYALLGSSRHLAVGPTSAISLLLGVSLFELSDGAPLQQLALASLTALLMCGAFVLAWLFRLSELVNFISESILTGFKAGAALAIAVTQLPKLLGIPGGGDDFFERIWLVCSQLPVTNLATLLVGLIALALLLLGDRWMPGRPVALGVVAIMVVAVAVGHLETRGVAVVGLIPAGLPQFQWAGSELARLELADSRQVIRLAGACFLLSYIESISAARTFALKHHYDIDPRQELLGLGTANFFSSLWQGYPIAGGLSQTAVNEGGGARSPLAIVIAAASICGVLLFFTGLLRALPQAVLAAVVLVAVKGLIDIGELRHLWRVSAPDFRAAVVALAGVLLMGVLDGVMVAVLASVAMLLWHGAHPHVAFLGRIPGTNRFSDRERHPDNESIPNVLIFRIQASLLYFNVDHVLDVVRQRMRSEIGLRRVICDLSNVPFVDISGARMLRRLDQELATETIDFQIVEAHAPVRDVLRSEGLDQQLGTITRFTSLAQLVDEGVVQPAAAGEKPSRE